MTTKKSLWLALLFVASATFPPTSCFAQNLNLKFQHLNYQNGLKETTNAFVYHDSKGYVWISSVEGIYRFDGLHLKHYAPDLNQNGALKEGLIQSTFFEDDKHNLWFSTSNGIYNYIRSKDKFKLVIIKDGKGDRIPPPYHLFQIVRDSILWISADQRIYECSIRTLRGKFTATSIGARYGTVFNEKGGLNKIIECPWVLDPGIGTIALNGSPNRNRYRQFQENGKLYAPTISAAIVQHDSIAWLCSNLGLIKVNLNKPEQDSILSVSTYPSVGIRNAVIVNNKFIVASGSQGLKWFDVEKKTYTQKWQHNPKNPNSISQPTTQEVYLDKEKILWVSLYGQGVDYASLHQNPFFFPMEAPKFTERKIKSITQDKDGKIWTIIINKGITVFSQQGHWIKDYLVKRDIPNEVQHLHVDQENEVWVVSSSILHLFDAVKEKFIPLIKLQESPEYAINQINRNLLFLSANNQLYKIQKNQSGKPIITDTTDFRQYCKLLPIQMKDHLFLHVGDSIKEFSILRNSIVPKRTISFPSFIYSSNKAKEKQIYLLSTDKGVIRFDANKMRYAPLKLDQKLGNTNFFASIEDDDHQIWSTEGVNIHVWNPPKQKIIFQPEDGIKVGSFQIGAFLKAIDGKLWFGGSDGLMYFDPKKIKPYPFAPKPHISSLLVNHIPYEGKANFDEASNLQFKYDQNNFEFEVVATGYYLSNLNKIRYRLLNYDQSWRIANNGETIIYSQLKPGIYVLELIAVNANGVESITKRISIKLHPPFWQTWWFITILVTFIFFISYSIYRYRINQLRKEWLLIQQTKDSEMKALRAQMSPHFIFNSLNSINTLVSNGENDKAGEALILFAELMRQILDNSSQEVITLDQEATFLQSYFQVESLRLEDKLEWEILIDDNIEKEGTEIPSMVLQPFVENAIWHGISYKPEGGKITIEIQKKHDSLICVIEDNGIGRIAAQEIQKRKKGKHESKGEKITLERLSLFDQKYGTQSSYQVIDLQDKNGLALGTRVILKLGLKL